MAAPAATGGDVVVVPASGVSDAGTAGGDVDVWTVIAAVGSAVMRIAGSIAGAAYTALNRAARGRDVIARISPADGIGVDESADRMSNVSGLPIGRTPTTDPSPTPIATTTTVRSNGGVAVVRMMPIRRIACLLSYLSQVRIG